MAESNRFKIPQNLGFFSFSISSCWVKFGYWNLGNSSWVFNWTESQLKFTSWTVQFHLFLSFLFTAQIPNLPIKNLIVSIYLLFWCSWQIRLVGFHYWSSISSSWTPNTFIHSFFVPCCYLIEFGDLISNLISLILFFVLIFRSVRLELS